MIHMNSKTRVSVLMPVYNGEKYLRGAIDSILRQTYSNYEFIIINDGSTDGSASLIKSYKDLRIRFIDNGINIGLPSTLNKGIELAIGEYIVRMDQDDVSLPERISKQVGFMDDYKEIGVCGTWIKFIGISYRPWSSRVYQYSTKPRDIMARSLFYTSFAHPSVIMRRALLDKFRLRYDSQHLYAEDYGFWQKCILYFPTANIPEPLLLYRVNPASMTNLGKEIGRQTVLRINRLNIQNFDIGFTPEELFICRDYPIDFKPEFLAKFHSWLEKLQEANFVKQIYPEPEFSQALAEEWFFACFRSSCLGIEVWRLFWRLPFGRALKLDMKQITRFFLKCTVKKGCPKQ